MQFPRMGTPGWPLPADPKDENYATNLDRMMASSEWDPSLNDVALLGCGPLGMPLALHAKERGLSAIYLGGLIQLLFGLIGRRYVEEVVDGKARGGMASQVFASHDQGQGSAAALVNAYWRPPLESETPQNILEQENGAYW